MCGYAVEVVRSCFESRWRLFRNSPQTTAGVYLFCPDDTPAYPGFHNLWSRDWTSDDLLAAPLGEDRSATRVYSLGAPIGSVPLPALIGSADCVENGDTWPLPVVPTLIGGFDARCPELLAAPRELLLVTDRGNWCFWATVINTTYTNSTAAMRQVAAALGVPVNGEAVPGPNGIMPTYFVLLSAPPAPLVVCIAGTDNATQWIVQFFYGARPPDDFGTFATHRIWWTAAARLLATLLTLHANTTQDIIIVGHSYGAAIACVLAARLRQAQPTRRIQLFTIGCPRPGDVRLTRILATTEVVSVQNVLDVVTGIPSNLIDVPPAFQFIVRSAYPPGSRLWDVQPNRFRVLWDGTVEQGAADPGLGPALQQIVDWGFGGGPFPDLGAHLQGEYQRRLCAPAAQPVLWLDAWDLPLTAGQAVVVWPNKVDAPSSPQAASLPVAGEMRIATQRLQQSVEFIGNAVLDLPGPVGGGEQWAFYAVLEIVYPQGSFPLLRRVGVPLGAVPGVPSSAAEWGSSSSSSPGLTLDAAGVTVSLPWSGDDSIPALLAVYYDTGTVTVYLEDVAGNTASAAGTAASIAWQYIGGNGAAPQPVPIGRFLLAELLFYDQVLPPVADASILDYLRLRWLQTGQGITTESGDPIATELMVGPIHPDTLITE